MEILGKVLVKMKLNLHNKCLIATPLLHLPKVALFIQSNSKYFQINETPTYESLLKYLSSHPEIGSIVVNPNAQGFVLDYKILSSSSLKLINTCSTGTNHIDLKACQDLGIEVLSLTRDYELINNLPSTAELAFCLLLSLYRNIPKCFEFVDNCNWNYTQVMGHQLADSRIGVLGYGRLGKIFCNQLRGFNAKIFVCEKSDHVNIPECFERVDIKTLFQTCDAVAIHIHATDSNKKIINHELLINAKPGLYLVNTSRGDIVCEDAITSLLMSKHLGGYATDVLASEFTNLEDSPILKLFHEKNHNVVITPHVGGMTYEGQEQAFLYALSKFKFSG